MNKPNQLLRLQEIDGLNVSSLEIGEGEKTIMFTHGWPGTKEGFEAMATTLITKRPDLKAILVDLPGFGQSQYPEGEKWDSLEYAGWLEKFCETLNTNSPVNLYAHSFSGRVALRLAERASEKIDKVILAAAAGLQLPVSPTGKIKQNLASQLAQLSSDVRGNELDIKMRDFFSEPRPDLSTIKAKTLVLWGGKDNVIKPKAAQIFSQALPNSKRYIIPEAGHSPHKTHPQVAATAVAEFL